MKPIDFPEKNVDVAKDQDEYLTLPAYVNKEETISCWQLTWWERVVVLFTGRLWFRQMNFGSPLQPQLPSVKSPFLKLKYKYD